MNLSERSLSLGLFKVPHHLLIGAGFSYVGAETWSILSNSLIHESTKSSSLSSDLMGMGLGGFFLGRQVLRPDLHLQLIFALAAVIQFLNSSSLAAGISLLGK